MKHKKILGIIIFCIGIVLLIAGFVIKQKVAGGREEISSAQSKVDKGSSLFNSSSATKPIGKIITGSAQKKIDAGSAEADEYERIANWLQISGIILLIVGGAVFIIYRKK